MSFSKYTRKNLRIEEGRENIIMTTNGPYLMSHCNPDGTPKTTPLKKGIQTTQYNYDRVVSLLEHYDSLSIKEISDILDISPPRVRFLLRELYEEEKVDHTDTYRYRRYFLIEKQS